MENFEAVRETEAYRSLPRHLADDVTAAACRRYRSLLRSLQCMAGVAVTPDQAGGGGTDGAGSIPDLPTELSPSAQRALIGRFVL